MNQIFKNIKKNLTIKNLFSDSPSRIFLVFSCLIIYRLIFDKPINNHILIIFFLTLGVTIHGLSKDTDVKNLESENKCKI